MVSAYFIFYAHLRSNLTSQHRRFFFRTERQCFKKKGYVFRHMIETDGVSCSILFVRKDKATLQKIKTPKVPKPEPYIRKLSAYTVRNKKIVAIDPGKCDLIYCVDGSSKGAKKYRYSQDRRRKETKKKKYAKIRMELKLKQDDIKGKSVIKHEESLSQFSRKSLELDAFQQYCQHKNELNRTLFQFYEQRLFRKLKLNRCASCTFISHFLHLSSLLISIKYYLFVCLCLFCLAIGTHKRANRRCFSSSRRYLGNLIRYWFVLVTGNRKGI